MSDDPKKRLSPQPDRAYEIPGGPKAKSLGRLEVKVLAEFRRGSEDDSGFDNRR